MPDNQAKPVTVRNILLLLGDQLPKYSIVFIVFGYFNTYNYYNFFSIPIYNYLDVSEIIFSFSSIFSLMYVLLFCTMIAIFPLAWAGGGNIEQRKNKLKNIFLFIIITFELGTAFVYAFYTSSTPEILIGLFFLINLLLILFFFARNYSKKRDDIIGVLKYVVCIFIFLSYIVTNNFASYRSIITNSPKFEVEMRLPNKIISSTKDLHYVGATNNYIFFYDVYSKKSMIYPKQNSDWISIKRAKHFIYYF